MSSRVDSRVDRVLLLAALVETVAVLGESLLAAAEAAAAAAAALTEGEDMGVRSSWKSGFFTSISPVGARPGHSLRSAGGEEHLAPLPPPPPLLTEPASEADPAPEAFIPPPFPPSPPSFSSPVAVAPGRLAGPITP
ncbi:hypothetical protein TYRP_003944 [Tyrophagus putrescentiae]|nr:hypothetical protein TYRP_003944 [Tyrophagus putrescentiae]